MAKSFARGRRLAAAVALLAAALLAPGTALADDARVFTCADNQEVSPALLAQAQARLGGSDAVSLASVLESVDDTGSTLQQPPSSTPLGLSTVGKVRGIVIRISFPASEDGSEGAMTIPADETDEQLLQAFNGEADSSSALYPYESLHAYYQRASYGKLDIQVSQVVNYTAKYPRSHYEGSSVPQALFVEALQAIDDDVNFADFDANNDGYIDSVYFQYAGPNGEWGSTWWPSKFDTGYLAELAGLQLDGKKVCGCSKINTIAADGAAALFLRTVIHETGHLLGLPDLYAYKSNPTGHGVGTFDMMSTNEGDQNGFFKWLLGWLDPEDITFVYVSEAGVDVRRGTGEVAHYDDSATIDLAAYTSDIYDKTGGVAVVSSDKRVLDGNLFCTFYLLQFDHAAGNQAISDGASPLGHGVRAFRVMAELNEYKTDFKKSNCTYGYSGNQLFEVLDPKLDGFGKEFGAFMHKGDVVSPTTNPSSNTMGSQEIGYTGVTFEIVSEVDDSAQVKCSWTKKSEDATFSLEPTKSEGITGANHFQLKSTWPAAQYYSPSESVYLEVGGEKYPVDWSYDLASGVMTVDVYCNPGTLPSGSKFELVVVAGVFDIGTDENGKSVMSDEIRVPLSAAGNFVPIDKSGVYEGPKAGWFTSYVTSEVALDPDGRAYFFESYKDKQTYFLRLYRVGEDGQSATSVSVDRSAVLGESENGPMKVVDLGDGMAALISSKVDGSSTPLTMCRIAWIELSSGKVLATRDVSALRITYRFFCLDGNLVYWDSGCSTADMLRMGYVDGAIVDLDAIPLGLSGSVSCLGGAGDGYVFAVVNVSDEQDAKAVSFYRTSDLLAAGGEGVACALSVAIPDCLAVSGTTVAGGRIYVLCRVYAGADGKELVNQLRVFSLEAELLDTIELGSFYILNGEVKVSDNGTVACATSNLSVTENNRNCVGKVVFYDPATGETSVLGDAQGISGVWLGERWLEVGQNFSVDYDDDDPATQVRWALTKEFAKTPADPDADPDPDPDPDPNPEPDSGPAVTTATQTNAGSSTSCLPTTGDESPVALATVLAFAGLCALACRKGTVPKPLQKRDSPICR
ncbi:M6 family metalloprotease domain-containing protein [Paratractidigestivibacter sp.]|uniref:M6 family metalloprotease domain-containing protein n=1 Tax=Paratractidigestivibacter sp. TaxID=2847316 RepID=UPI002ACB05C4|nr:M6 family metalloprotease domain-containing protein [Paratractidigestivibacter sp.]